MTAFDALLVACMVIAACGLIHSYVSAGRTIREVDEGNPPPLPRYQTIREYLDSEEYEKTPD